MPLLHLPVRTIWLGTCSLFLSTQFYRLCTHASTNTNTTNTTINTKTTTVASATRPHRPATPMLASWTTSLLQALLAAKNKGIPMGVRTRARVQGTYDEGVPCGDDEANIRYDEHDE